MADDKPKRNGERRQNTAVQAKAQASLERIFTIPNQLTMARLLLLPFVLIAMLYERHVFAWWLFVTAAVTDWIDGFIARRFHQQTSLGMVLDPIADKLLMTSSFVVQAQIGAVPWWLTILVLARDVAIIATVAAVMFSTEIRKFPPNRIGKASTVVQSVTIAAVLLNNAYPHSALTVACKVLFAATAGLILLSAITYARVILRRIHIYNEEV